MMLAMHDIDIAILSVCPSVMCRYSTETTKFLHHMQGRRHGFESGGGQFASKKFFLTPHFLASGGDKILLR